MLRLDARHGPRHCDGLTRRDWLRIGTLGVGGLTLPNVFKLEASSPRRARARSVIMLFLSGGPSHLDMWDLKPNAPEEIPFTGLLNRVPKYVATRTLSDPLAWQGSTTLQGDLTESVSDLKDRHDETHVIGSLDLTRADERTDPINLRLYLRHADKPLTETWIYQWTPPPADQRKF